MEPLIYLLLFQPSKTIKENNWKGKIKRSNLLVHIDFLGTFLKR